MEDLRLSPPTAPAAHRAGWDSEEQPENPAAQNLQTAAEGLKEPRAARRRDLDPAWVRPSGASVPPPAPPCLRLQTTTTLRPPHRQGAAASRRGRTRGRPPSRQDVGHVVLGVAQLRGSRDTSQPEEQRGGGEEGEEEQHLLDLVHQVLRPLHRHVPQGQPQRRHPRLVRLHHLWGHRGQPISADKGGKT